MQNSFSKVKKLCPQKPFKTKKWIQTIFLDFKPFECSQFFTSEKYCTYMANFKWAQNFNKYFFRWDN